VDRQHVARQRFVVRVPPAVSAVNDGFAGNMPPGECVGVGKSAAARFPVIQIGKGTQAATGAFFIMQAPLGLAPLMLGIISLS
jgi:hypothetical protein